MSQEKEKIRPKGAMSAYAYFVQVIREEHKRKHPGEQVVFSEFSKKCAEKWKLMTPKEKKRFEEMANSDKDRFNKEMNTYQPPVDGSRKKRKRRRIKEPGQPKRAWSAFFFFCDEFRPKIRELHPDWRVGNIAKELGRLWESCENKLKYEKQSEADKQRYEEQMGQYRAGEYIAPLKRPRMDSNSGQILAGSSSTDGHTAISNDAVVNEDEEMEEEDFEEGEDSENGLDNAENIRNTSLNHNLLTKPLHVDESTRNGKSNELSAQIASSNQSKVDFITNNTVVEESNSV